VARVTNRRAPLALPLAAATALASTAIAGAARADATGWASASGGVAYLAPAASIPDADGEREELRSQLAFDVGVGTSPASPIIVGGLFRVSPTIGELTDFSWVLRGANRTFQSGPIGIALDVGFYARADEEASIGLVGGPIVGGPLGLQLAIQGHLGSEDELGASALLGVDLLRLTMYREDLLEWWPNPAIPDKDRASR
jgi:hypothetical protein